jgi:hypothetical protein
MTATRTERVDELAGQLVTARRRERVLIALVQLLASRAGGDREDAQRRTAAVPTADAAEDTAPPRALPGDYPVLVNHLGEIIAACVPAGAVVAIVSKGDPMLVALDGRIGWHFPGDDAGNYLGYYPADDHDAIQLLEQTRMRGATHLVVPATSRWWLDHYVGFRTHVETAYEQVLDEPDVCVIYSLQVEGVRPGHATQPIAAILATLLPVGSLVHFVPTSSLRTLAVFGCEVAPLHVDDEHPGALPETGLQMQQYVVVPSDADADQLRSSLESAHRTVLDQKHLGTVFELVSNPNRNRPTGTGRFKR